MSGRHDLGYKLLFAHPELVQQLVAGFTPFAHLAELEATAYERVNPSYVSDQFSERHDDLVWRVRCRGQWLYVYLLLEFQSGIDHWMALRMQVYVGLLYQDLVKRGDICPDAMLPPVLPLVFYNGAGPWSATLDLGAIIAPAPDGLAEFQAAQRYFLIDQRRLDTEALARNRTVLATLFRLELSEVPDVVLEVLPLLATWFQEDAQSPLRRDVASWVEQLVNREFKGTPIFCALEEPDMGARKFETWADAFEDRGLQRGLAQGLVQGREQGREQGLEQGREQACAALRSILQRMLVKRFQAVPPGSAARIAQAPMEQLEEWINRAMDADSVDALFGPRAAPDLAPPAS